MKKILCYTSLTLILGALSFSGCANKEGSRERVDEKPGETLDTTFEKGGAMERGNRSTDKVEDKY